VIGPLGTTQAEPLVDKVTATIHCRLPLGHHCTRGKTVEIPLKDGVDAGADGANLALAKKQVVGGVAGDAGNGVVRYVGAVESEGGDAVKIEVEGLSRADSYDGAIDLQPADEKSGTVTVKATVSDSWGWALGVLGLGILAGLLLVRYAGSGRALFNLRTRRSEALIDLDDAQNELDKAARPPAWHAPSVRDAAGRVGDAIQAKLDTLGRTSFSEPDAGVVKEIEALLATVATAAADVRALATALPALADAVGRLEKREPYLSELVPPQTSTPALADAARLLLAGGELESFEELTARLDGVRASTALLVKWKSNESLVSAYKRDLDEIDPTGLSAEDQALHAKTLTDLGSVCQTLWDVRGVDDFETQSIVRDLAEVHRNVSHLKAAWRPSLVESLEYIRARGLPDVWIDGRGLDAAPRPPAAPPPPDAASERSRLRRRLTRGFAGEALLTVAAFAIALVTGLSALYMGKSWGTWIDYANAFLWGIVTKTALDLLLVPSLDQMAKVRPFGALLRRV
jgi:hypothetical protein